MEDPIHPSPKRLLAAESYLRRKEAIAALVNHYSHRPAAGDGANISSEDLTAVELGLLKRILGVAHQGAPHITRNSYFVQRLGSKHRVLEGLRDRGLVTLIEQGSLVTCQTTSLGVSAVVRALKEGKAA